MHADYLSGARAAAARWQVPYFVHPDDARPPYDGAEGRFTHQSLTEGDTIAFGRATLVAAHVPGHTLGSTALVADEALALTGDFLLVKSVGRPDLGGQRDAWAARLWDSLERVRREWAGDLLVLPAQDRKSTRLNSSHGYISYAVFCLKKKKNKSGVEHFTIHTTCNAP